MKGIAVAIAILFSISIIPTYAADVSVIPNQYILKVDANEDNIKQVAEDIVRDLEEEYGRDIEILDIYEKLGVVAIEIKPSFGVSSMSSYDIKHPDIELAVNNIKVRAMQQVTPTGIDRIDLDKRLPLGTGVSVNGGVAVLDTGIDLDHPDLNVSTLSKYCVSWDGKDSADDDNGHGTHVAGIIGAKDNNIGVVGVAPGVTLYSVKVLDKNGSGTLNSIICGIAWITGTVTNGTDIDAANMSFGGYCPASNPICFVVDSLIGNLLQTSTNVANVVYVASAGNDASNAIDYWPARFDEVITVSAIDDSDGRCGSQLSDDKFAPFSNFGPVVDIAAPGVDILSTYPNGYAISSGTSMAAPHVTGATILYKADNPTATVAEIRAAILSNSIPQNWPCNISKNNGYGGFTNDPDLHKEPLLYVAGDTWINDIQDNVMIGESVDCEGYTDLEHLINAVECELIDPSNNTIDTLTTSTHLLATSPPDNCGSAGDCIVFTNTFATNTPNMPGDWTIRAKFLDASNNIIAIKDKSVRVDSFFVLPEAAIGSIAIVGSALGMIYLYARRR